MIAESLGESSCVNGTQTDSCSAQLSSTGHRAMQCFLPSWQLSSSGVQALCSPDVTQAELG